MVRTFDVFDHFAKMTIKTAGDEFDFFGNFDSGPAARREAGD